MKRGAPNAAGKQDLPNAKRDELEAVDMQPVEEGAMREDCGPKVVAWDGRDDRGRKVAPGVYVYQLGTGDFQGTKRAIMLR